MQIQSSFHQWLQSQIQNPEITVAIRQIANTSHWWESPFLNVLAGGLIAASTQFIMSRVARPGVRHDREVQFRMDMLAVRRDKLEQIMMLCSQYRDNCVAAFPIKEKLERHRILRRMVRLVSEIRWRVRMYAPDAHESWTKFQTSHFEYVRILESPHKYTISNKQYAYRTAAQASSVLINCLIAEYDNIEQSLTAFARAKVGTLWSQPKMDHSKRLSEFEKFQTDLSEKYTPVAKEAESENPALQSPLATPAKQEQPLSANERS